MLHGFSVTTTKKWTIVCLLCSVNFVTVYIGVLRDTFLLTRIVRIKLFVPTMNETTFLSTQITKTVMSLELKNLKVNFVLGTWKTCWNMIGKVCFWPIRNHLKLIAIALTCYNLSSTLHEQAYNYLCILQQLLRFFSLHVTFTHEVPVHIAWV